MLTFKEQFSFVTKIKSLFSFLKEKIRDLLDLSFGQKKSIRIDLSKMRNEILSESADLKSHIGYYAEYTTAYNLSLIIEKNGGNLTTTRSQPSHLKKIMMEKRNKLLSLDLKPGDKKKLPEELERMESSGLVLSKTIFEDVRLNGQDYNALQFDIELTGDSEKGSSKADLILTVGKMSKKEIVDRIFASIKAYKTAEINLSNNTPISFLKHLFYDDTNRWGKKIEPFIIDFSKDYGSKNDLKKIYELQNVIKTKIEKGSSKENARKFAKTTHPEIIEFMAKVFNQHYFKHKEEINKRVLKIMGFDGSDDFYAAIGKTKQKSISSRQSEEMKKMLEQFQQEFTITFERNKQTKNANMIFVNKDNKEILRAQITFSDTGSSSGYTQKTNIFAKLRPFIKK
jgi:hypothetical protein